MLGRELNPQSLSKVQLSSKFLKLSAVGPRHVLCSEITHELSSVKNDLTCTGSSNEPPSKR